MAYKYDWGDGKGRIRSISKAEHDANLKKLGALRTAAATPPSSLYDPALDQQERAGGRGLGDLIADIGADTGIQRVRASDDYTTAGANLAEQRRQAEEDYTTGTGRYEQGYQRSLADLLTQRAQGTQDYQTNVANLDRSYQRLGTSQNEAARKAGAMTGSGAQLQAARKRSENEAIDRAPIDTAYQRFQAQSALDESRLGEDRANALSDLLTGITRQRGVFDTQGQAANLAYTRQGADWDTQLQRAQREFEAQKQDLADTRVAQATQAGWTMPSVRIHPLTTTPPKKKKPRTVTYTSGVNTP